MKRKLLKNTLMSFSFVCLSAQAQVVVEDNFQSYGQKNYDVFNATTPCVADETTVPGAKYCNCKPDAGTVPVATSFVAGAGTVSYALVNAGIQDVMCGTRGGSNTTITRVGSDGYIELGKKAEYTTGATAGIAGSVVISKIPYVGTVTFTTHATGGNRKAATGSTARGGYLFKSSDNGGTWERVTATASGGSAADAALLVDATQVDESFATDVYGATFTAVIDASDVLLKFESITEKIRINDLKIDATVPVSVTDLFVDGSASTTVEGNVLSVISAEAGQVQVLGMNGTLVAQNPVAAQDRVSFDVKSGVYMVKLVTDHNISVKKVIVR